MASDNESEAGDDIVVARELEHQQNAESLDRDQMVAELKESMKKAMSKEAIGEFMDKQNAIRYAERVSVVAQEMLAKVRRSVTDDLKEYCKLYRSGTHKYATKQVNFPRDHSEAFFNIFVACTNSKVIKVAAHYEALDAVMTELRYNRKAFDNGRLTITRTDHKDPGSSRTFCMFQVEISRGANEISYSDLGMTLETKR